MSLDLEDWSNGALGKLDSPQLSAVTSPLSVRNCSERSALFFAFVPRILAQRFAGFEMRLQLFQQRQLRRRVPVRICVFWSCAMRFRRVSIRLRSLMVEFEIHRIDVAERIDRTADVEHAGILKGADDVAERVHVLELVQPLLAQFRLRAAGRGQACIRSRRTWSSSACTSPRACPRAGRRP